MIPLSSNTINVSFSDTIICRIIQRATCAVGEIGLQAGHQPVEQIVRYLSPKFLRGHSNYDVRLSVIKLVYSSRYYFILFEVDAPIKMRYKRFTNKYSY
jgi:hypothetical protein